jgi:hypothetical protein
VGPEFFAAFQIARMALDGIRSCVDMLNEGKGELKAVTGEIKQGVESAKAIYTEVTSFWAWLTKLLGIADKPAKQVSDISVVDTPKSTTAEEPAKQAKKQAAKQAEGPSVDDVIEQFLTHFTNFIEAQTTILDAIEDEREKILNVWNPKQNNRRAAIDLIRYERRIDDMAMELSGLMASAPRKLGSVREQFSEKLDIVRDAQAAAKSRARVKRQQELWQQDLLRNHRIDRGVTAATVVLVILWLWGMLLSLGWLVKIPAGSLLPLLF